MQQHSTGRWQCIAMAIIGSLLVTACATLSKEECVNANWETIGFSDGHNGDERSRIDAHREACAEYRVQPDLTKYLQGYERGVRIYCEPQRGFKRGRMGNAATDVCPEELRSTYLSAYADGRYLYDHEHSMQQHEKTIKELHKQIDTAEAKRQDAENKLIDGHIPQTERARLVELIRRIDDDRLDKLEKIKKHKAEILLLADELQDFEDRQHLN
jgi:hypothetical protein